MPVTSTNGNGFADIDAYRAAKRAAPLKTQAHASIDGTTITASDILLGGSTDSDKARVAECREGLTREDYGALADRERMQIRSERSAGAGYHNSPMTEGKPARKPLPATKPVVHVGPSLPISNAEATRAAPDACCVATPRSLGVFPFADIKVSPRDPEIAAMAEIAALLKPLNQTARRRVLNWAVDRFRFSEAKTTP